MRDAEILLLVRDLRARAREISARAETFNDADARQKMRAIAATYLKLAATYEKLALHVERRARFGLGNDHLGKLLE